jgi:FkbM family methyltransferase
MVSKTIASLKDIARVVLRRNDPFRHLQRDATEVAPPYHSQYGQDRVLREELFGARRGGVFVEIGAHDGLSFNNTAYFERELGWTGLCVEPIPEVYDELVRNRGAIAVRACVARRPGVQKFLRVRGYAEMLSGLVDAYDPRHVARIESEVREAGGSSEVIDVEVVRLDELLARHGIATIDLLCVDVEGAELEVLGSFDLRRVRPKVVCIENNYLQRSIWRFMRAAGYRPYARIRQDEIYLARGYQHG